MACRIPSLSLEVAPSMESTHSIGGYCARLGTIHASIFEWTSIAQSDRSES